MMTEHYKNTFLKTHSFRYISNFQRTFTPVYNYVTHILHGRP